MREPANSFSNQVHQAGSCVMNFRKAVTTAAAIAMIAMPAIAQAANTASAASRLSVGAAKVAPGARAGAAVAASNKAAPGSTVIAILAGLAVAAGIYVAVDSSD